MKTTGAEWDKWDYGWFIVWEELLDLPQYLIHYLVLKPYISRGPVWLEIYSAKKSRYFNANIFILNKIYLKIVLQENLGITLLKCTVWKIDNYTF